MLAVISLVLAATTLARTTSAASCPMYCTCAKANTVAYCYSGGLNDTNFYHILESLPSDLVELDIQALEKRPNKFHWNDNLNRFTKLRRLTLKNCGIPALSQRIRLRSLEELRLPFNALDNLQMDSFNGMPNLQTLDLSYNRISVLQSGCFVYLKSLRSLSLSHNQLSVLPSNLLHGPRKLLELQLDGNVLPVEQINNLLNLTPDLQRLDLNFCGLDDASMQLLHIRNVLQLRRLGIGGNNLSFVPSASFRALEHLETVDLSFNKIRRLEPCAFCSCNISTILLGNNLLGIDENAFHIEAFAHVNITTLDVSFNFLDHFDSRILGGAQPTLESLNLGGNTLVSVSSRMVHTLPALRVLNLATNHIDELPRTWPPEFGSLLALNLSDNHISRVPGELGDSLHKLMELDLSNNLLTDLPVSLTDFFTSKSAILYLHNNPWDCRCAAQSLQQYLSRVVERDPEREGILCAEPADLQGLRVASVRNINECAILFNSRYQLTQMSELIILIIIVTGLSCIAALGLITMLYCTRSRAKKSKPYQYGQYGRSSSQAPLTHGLDANTLSFKLNGRDSLRFAGSLDEYVGLSEELPPALKPITFTSY